MAVQVVTADNLKQVVRGLLDEIQAAKAVGSGTVAAPAAGGDAMVELVRAEIQKAISPVNEKLAGLSVVQKDQGAQESFGYKGLGDYAMDVVQASNISSPKCGIDPRLKAMMQKAAGDAMTPSNPEYGGFLIPPVHLNKLMELTYESANIFNECAKVEMAANSLEIPAVNGFDRSSQLIAGGIQMYWLDTDESREITSSKAKFETIGLQLGDLCGMVYLTRNMVDDSPISIDAYLRTAFAQALALKLDVSFFSGAGKGQPLGALYCPALITVSKEADEGAEFLYENALKMYARQYNKANAVWYMNHDLVAQLGLMNIICGSGGAPVFLPSDDAAGRPLDTLLGRPIRYTEVCSALGTLGDVVFADFSQYLVGTKQGMPGVEFASSIHLKFEYAQTALRFMFRLAGKPWWASPLTPVNGSTLSPFVTLEARP